MKKAIAISLLAGVLTACAGMRADNEYKELVAKAENEIKLANQTGFAWSNTENFLKESKEAKEAGDMDKAMKLAKKALDEAQLAQQQAKANADPKADFTFKQ